jgi:hypothetical protein
MDRGEGEIVQCSLFYFDISSLYDTLTLCLGLEGVRLRYPTLLYPFHYVLM